MRLPAWVPVVVVLALASACISVGQREDSSAPTTSAVAETSDLSQPRSVHRATALADGTVLITGGCTEPGCGGFEQGRRSELFDPVTSTFTVGPTMLEARASGTATLLDDGRVLLIGGYPGEGQPPTASAEVYDPDSGEFRAVSSLSGGRADHSATLLGDGTVLVAGGFELAGRPLTTTELFDPATDAFSDGPALSEPRAGHAAVVVSGTMILIGGTRTGPALASTDVLRRGTWAPGPQLARPRVKLAAVSVGSRQALVIGGSADTEGHRRLDSTELLVLGLATTRPGPTLSEREYKLDGAVATLPDGRVVIAGGARLNLYDPESGTMEVLQEPLLTRRSFVTATAISSDRVLVAGGYDDQIVPTDDALLASIPPT